MMDYVDTTVQTGFFGYGVNICFDCSKACGGCSWSEIDESTGRVKFEPVPGWKTCKRSRKEGRKWKIVEQIVYCPLFDSDRRRNYR